MSHCGFWLNRVRVRLARLAVLEAVVSEAIRDVVRCRAEALRAVRDCRLKLEEVRRRLEELESLV